MESGGGRVAVLTIYVDGSPSFQTGSGWWRQREPGPTVAARLRPLRLRFVNEPGPRSLSTPTRRKYSRTRTPACSTSFIFASGQGRKAAYDGDEKRAYYGHGAGVEL